MGFVSSVELLASKAIMAPSGTPAVRYGPLCRACSYVAWCAHGVGWGNRPRLAFPRRPYMRYAQIEGDGREGIATPQIQSLYEIVYIYN